MATFTERMGLEPQRTLQISEMSAELRNSVWNLIYDLYDWQYWESFAGFVARSLRKSPADTVPDTSESARKWVKEYFYSLDWGRTYNFVEFVCQLQDGVGPVSKSTVPKRLPKGDVLRFHFNQVFERELSAYRFVARELVPITNEAEGAAIDSAVKRARADGFAGAATHLETALKKLALKPQPDYRNAIKEAISAVESAAQVLAGDRATLDKALKAIAPRIAVHPALQKGFQSLYGYAGDEQGVRHAMQDDPSVGFAEAKFFVVACSAFVHYLLEKGAAAGQIKPPQGD